MTKTCVIQVIDEVNVRLVGLDEHTLKQAQDALTFRVPNSMYMEKVRAKRWDGKIRLLSATGKTFRHLLFKILPGIVKAGYECAIDDQRFDHKIQISEIGDDLFEGYSHKRFHGIMEEHQVEAINKLTSHGNGIIVLATGGGKAQPFHAKVLTPLGWKNMGDICVSDRVVTAHGKITEVDGVYPQGIKSIFRVTFEDGRTAECTDEHLWKVYNVYWSGDRYRVLPLLQIKKEMELRKAKGYFIDLYQPDLNESNADLLVDPYVMGVLLGDGGVRTSIRFTTADHHIVKKIRHLLGSHYEINKVTNTEYDYSITHPSTKKNPLTDSLLSFGLFGKYSYEKHVPECFLNASTKQRLSLIQGLMDTDGEIDYKGTIGFSSTSEVLADQMVYLIRSVGGLCKKVGRTTSYIHNGERRQWRRSYRLHIRHNNPECLFSLPRKLARINPDYQYRDKWKLKIKSIEEIGSAECQCISVIDPSRLYVTDNFVVTHNTIITAGLSQLYYPYGKILIIVPRIDLVVETHATVQAMGMMDCGMFFDELKDPKYITVTTWQSLENCPELFHEVAAVIVDEAHGADAKVLHKLLVDAGKNVPIRIGMTGTMPEDDLAKYQIQAALGPVIYEKKARDLQRSGFLAYCQIFILKYQDKKRQSYIDDAHNHQYYIDEMRWQWENQQRILHISETIREFSKDGNTLVLVRNREYQAALLRLLPEAIGLNGSDKGSYRHKIYQETNAKNNAILICTYGIASTGIDVARLFNLVLIEPGRKNIPVIQSIGRGLRKADDKDWVMVYHIGSDAKFSARHVVEVQRIYKENTYPFEIVEVDYE
jgi:superfamily II DNA or RNA helicase